MINKDQLKHFDWPLKFKKKLIENKRAKGEDIEHKRHIEKETHTRTKENRCTRELDHLQL